jgi:hypothetical protein
MRGEAAWAAGARMKKEKEKNSAKNEAPNSLRAVLRERERVGHAS